MGAYSFVVNMVRDNVKQKERKKKPNDERAINKIAEIVHKQAKEINGENCVFS